MRILGLLLLAGCVCAQDRPQFVWQGQVDGVDILYLRGNRIDVQAKEGAPVEGQRFRFYSRLPETRQDVRLQVNEGRGYVHIIDQPRIENNYTLAVALEDRQPGSSFYSIALFWDTSGRRFDGSRSSGKTDRLAWSGRVDEEAIVSCRGNVCNSSATRGAPVAAERFKFSRPLPARDVQVSVEEALGRGEIRLIEQPRERNNYTARLQISDPPSGSGEYSFVLTWERPTGNQPELVSAQRGLIWSGRVDDRIRVSVQGGSAFSEVVRGQPIAGEHVDFIQPLPSRSDLSPAVKKIRGRGRVEIVEYPSNRNNFRLVFEIEDPEGGADDYEVEVDW